MEKKVSTDPVNLALIDLGIGIAPPERKIRNVDLTDAQYDDYARIAGRMTKMNLDKIVRSEAWNRIGNSQKHDLVKRAVEANREAARGYVMVSTLKFPATRQKPSASGRRNEVYPSQAVRRCGKVR